MSHYTVPMTPDLKTNEQKQQASLKAIVDYLGKARFNKVAKTFAEEARQGGYNCRKTYRMVRFYLPFTGCEGFWPARAMFAHVWPLV